jgi:hypothetical protein
MIYALLLLAALAQVEADPSGGPVIDRIRDKIKPRPTPVVVEDKPVPQPRPRPVRNWIRETVERFRNLFPDPANRPLPAFRDSIKWLVILAAVLIGGYVLWRWGR